MKYYVVEMRGKFGTEWSPIKSLDNIGIGAITFDSRERLSLEQAQTRIRELSRDIRFVFRISEFDDN